LIAYSCDHFVEPKFRLGNIKEQHMLELVDSPQQRRFGLDKRDTLPRYCRDCDVRFACHGGCPKDRFIETPDGEPGLNYLCAGYKAFFHHVDGPMRFMPSGCATARRRPRSSRITRTRIRGAAATIRALAALGASGSTATGRDRAERDMNLVGRERSGDRRRTAPFRRNRTFGASCLARRADSALRLSGEWAGWIRTSSLGIKVRLDALKRTAGS
jgi:radical SAM protein with 4Fe4S-binding SPASM domain